LGTKPALAPPNIGTIANKTNTTCNRGGPVSATERCWSAVAALTADTGAPFISPLPQSQEVPQTHCGFIVDNPQLDRDSIG
jgi:hypothetical protein